MLLFAQGLSHDWIQLRVFLCLIGYNCQLHYKNINNSSYTAHNQHIILSTEYRAHSLSLSRGYQGISAICPFQKGMLPQIQCSPLPEGWRWIWAFLKIMSEHKWILSLNAYRHLFEPGPRAWESSSLNTLQLGKSYSQLLLIESCTPDSRSFSNLASSIFL